MCRRKVFVVNWEKFVTFGVSLLLGVCSLSRNVIQLNSYWSQSSTCLDFYSRKCADAILELGDTSSEGDDEDDFCIIQVFASFKDCMSISDLNRIVECIGNCLVVKNSKMSPSRKKRKRNSLHFAEALLPLLFTVKQPYGSKETGGRVKINASIFKHLLSMMSLLIEENTTTTSSSSTGTNLLAMKHAVEHVLLAYLSPPSSSSALSRSIVVMDENFSVPANVPSLFSNELVDQLISQCSGHDWQTARLVGLILRSSVNQRQRLAGIVSRRELEEPPATIMCIAILRSFMDGFCSVKMVCIGAKSSSDPSAPQHHLARLLIKNTGSNEESAIKRMYKQIRADLSTQLAHIFDDDLVGIDGGSEEEEMMEIDAREKLVVARYILKEPMFLFNLASIVKMEQGSVLQNALSGFFASQTGGTDPSVLCERMCTLFEPLLSSCFPKNEEVNIDDASTSTAVLVVDRTVGQLFAKLLAAVSICLQTYISKTVKKLPNDTVLSSFIASNSAENIIGKLIEYSRILIQVLTKNWASIGGAKSLDNLTSLTPEGDSLWNLLQSVIMSCMKYRLLDPRCMFFIGDLIHLMSKVRGCVARG